MKRYEIREDERGRGLFDNQLGDFFHNRQGIFEEAHHVFIKNGCMAWREKHQKKRRVRILEMGFGTGVNCICVYNWAQSERIDVEYISLDLYPLDMDTQQDFWQADFSKMEPYIKADWRSSFNEGGFTRFTQETVDFGLQKIVYDIKCLRDLSILKKSVDVVMFDAFSPDAQPELWQITVFKEIFDVQVSGGLWVSYASRTMIKKALEQSGYRIKIKEGALGKREMLQAWVPVDQCT